MNSKQYFSFLDSGQISTVDDVARALKQLDRALAKTSLAPLQNFNRTYYIITKNVQSALRQQGFQYSAFLQQFDVRFASYYFRAIEAYLQHKPLAPAWREAFESCRAGNDSSAKVTALGVSAHVNNDIPQVLHDLRAQSWHRADYNYVNKIIKGSISEVIATLNDATTVLNPQRRGLRLPAKIVMNLLLRFWRASAWRSYRRLLTTNASVEQLEARAQRQAKRLVWLPI